MKYKYCSEVKVFNISKADYLKIHKWARKNIIKPEKCKCNSNKKLEISNKSNTYKYDINDWEWLCRSCHKKTHKFKHTEKTKKLISKKTIGEKNGFYKKKME